jgi:uncharacterized repeat protein (TIGR01451 family)
MRRWIPLPITIALALPLLSGCGQSDTTTGTSNVGAAASASRVVALGKLRALKPALPLAKEAISDPLRPHRRAVIGRPAGLEPPPKLSINAVVSRDPIGAGHLLTYTLLFGNAGGLATGVTVTATTPVGTTFQSASPAPTSAPSVGGTGATTWSFTEVPHSGGGMVTITVQVGPGLPNDAVIVLTGYQVAAATPPMVDPGPDVTTTVQTDLSLEIEKVDAPDGVEPGNLLTYEITVANSGDMALHGVVVRELFDPNLETISSLPPADIGTSDRWSIPFLPVGASRTIGISAQVRTNAEAGAIIRNLAEVEDETGRMARTYEDTLIVGSPVLAMSIDDMPDPVRPTDELVYAITFANLGNADLSGVTVFADPDPNLVLQSASPPEDGSLFWNIGTMAGTSAGRIFATFTVNPTMPKPLDDGVLLPMRAWVMDDGGNVANALEVTLFRTETGPDTPYLLNLTGAPRNLRFGTVETGVYLVKLSNEGASPTTDVTVNYALAPGLEFVESDPPPTSLDGNRASFTFPTVPPGETKMIVIKAELGPTAVPGSTLTNRANVLDAEGNSAQATFSGGVRAGTPGSDGKLGLNLTMPNRLTIAGGRPGTLKSTLMITNGGRGDAHNVVVTLEGPPSAAYESASPAATLDLTGTGRLRLTWFFASIKGPGNRVIKLTQKVDPSVPSGSGLSFSATLEAEDGRRDDDSHSVEVRNR